MLVRAVAATAVVAFVLLFGGPGRAQVYCPHGGHWCGQGRGCCKAGTVCAPNGGCMPPGNHDCGPGRGTCPSGYRCAPVKGCERK